MTLFQKFKTRDLYDAIGESIDKYNKSDDKDEQCNPNVPLTIFIEGKKHYVLSVGGDPNEEGLIFEAKPEKWWK